VFETGDLGADAAPEPKDVTRHQSLLALRQAAEDAGAELDDRTATGEV
jgi:tRNA(Arg) A34 adenosine deaminase TadA